MSFCPLPLLIDLGLIKAGTCSLDVGTVRKRPRTKSLERLAQRVAERRYRVLDADRSGRQDGPGNQTVAF